MAFLRLGEKLQTKRNLVSKAGRVILIQHVWKLLMFLPMMAKILTWLSFEA